MGVVEELANVRQARCLSKQGPSSKAVNLTKPMRAFRLQRVGFTESCLASYAQCSADSGEE